MDLHAPSAGRLGRYRLRGRLRPPLGLTMHFPDAKPLHSTLNAFWASVLVFAALLCASQAASAQFTQQGSKLVGTGYSGTPGQGGSAGGSGGGKRGVVGGSGDNCITGAAWVFSRNGGAWSQQGSKLVGPVAGSGCN